MGHPDKVSDQISDALVDAIYTEEIKNGGDLTQVRCAIETLCTTGQVVVAGEVRTNAYVDVLDIVRDTIKKIGYHHPEIGFSYDSCGVMNAIHSQSDDIARGVDKARDGGSKTEAAEEGAGDQGLMFGYACRETEDLMPLPIWLSHRIVEKQAQLRESGEIPWLRPDAKSQVTVEYDTNDRPVRVRTIVMSTQHSKDVLDGEVMSEEAKQLLIDKVVKPCIPNEFADDEIVYHINPTGRFVIGGPHGDTGLTGRKIIVDTYGGRGRHGGGAFSGKDPSKVDRSAAYMARYVAKNIVASGLADEVEVQLAYAIGIAKPVSVRIDTNGTAKISEQDLSELVRDTFPLTPRGIIKHLDLLKPIFFPTARHGHFGRQPGEEVAGSFSWEKTDMAAKLAKAAEGLAAVTT